MLKIFKASLFAFSLFVFSSPVLGQFSWKTYTSLNFATAVETSPGDVIWVATSGGLYKLDRSSGRLQTFTNIEGLSDTRLTALQYDPTLNTLWIGTESGVISSLNLSNFRISNSFEISSVSQFVQKSIRGFALSGDSLFVATDFGIALYTPSRREIRETYIRLGEFTSGAAINSILLTDSLLIAGTGLGIAIAPRNAQNLIAPSTWQNISTTAVTALATIEGALFIGTANSLLRYNLTLKSLETVLTNEPIIDLRVASQTLVALTRNDLVSISTSITRRPSNFSNATSLAILSDGTRLISDKVLSLIFVGESTITPIELNTPLRNRFEKLGVDSRGRLWVSSTVGNEGAEGVYRFEPATERWTNYPSINATGANGALLQFNAFTEQNNSFYLGGWGNGLVKIEENDSLRGYSNSNSSLVGLPNSPNFIVISDVLGDESGLVWMANYRSLGGALAALLPDGTIKGFGPINSSNTPATLNGFPQGVFAFRLAIDQLGRKWVACLKDRLDEGEGVIIFDDNNTLDNPNDDRYVRITTQANAGSLPSARINAIKMDSDGAIWFATDLGAAYYFDASIVQQGNIPTVFPIFDLQNESLTSLAIDALNRKWFGSTNGVWLLTPDGSSVIQHFTAANSQLISNRVFAIEADKRNGRVYIGTDRGLSVLQTLSVEPVSKMENLFIAPNPVMLPETALIRITGLSRNASLKIITVTGQLIRDIKSDGGAVALWDGKDNRGEFVASGVYIAVGISENGKESGLGKIAIIRKGR